FGTPIRATRFIGSSPSATFRLATRSTSSLAPVSKWKIKRSNAPRRIILPTTRALVRVDFSSGCLDAHLAAANVVKRPGPKRAEARDAAASSRRLRIVTQRPRHPPTKCEGLRASVVMRRQKRVEDARKRAYDPRIHPLCTKVFTKVARARLRGVQVCFCPFGVIVVQQLAEISLLYGPRPRRMNWPFRDSVCAVKRRAGACRLMQVTVRIRLPTARDARNWRVHRRSSPTAEVWNSAG